MYTMMKPYIKCTATAPHVPWILSVYIAPSFAEKIINNTNHARQAVSFVYIPCTMVRIKA